MSMALTPMTALTVLPSTQTTLRSNTLSLLRLAFVSSLFLINFLSLLKLTFNRRLSHCIHTTTSVLVVVTSTAYLSSWLPYLFHSFYNLTAWPIIDIKAHCIIQHSVSGQIMTILFAVLCTRTLYDAFTPIKARIMSLAVFIAWTVPQLVYMTMGEVANIDHTSFFFLARVQSTNSTLHSSDRQVVTEGLILCVHKLSSAVFAQMSWHYVVFVIPMTVLIVICMTKNYLKKPSSSKGVDKDNRCKCSTDIILNICLYLSFLWLLIVRPLLVVNTLISKSGDPLSEWPHNRWSAKQSTLIDLGAQLIHMIIAILVPFSSNGLFREYIVTFKQRVISSQ